MYNGTTPQSPPPPGPPMTYGSEAYGMFPAPPAAAAADARPTFSPTPAYATTSLPPTPTATGGAGWAYQARQASHVENPPWTWVPPAQPQVAVPQQTGPMAIVLRVFAVIVLVVVGGGFAVGLVFRHEITDAYHATRTEVVTPNSLNGRPRVIGGEEQRIVDNLLADLGRKLPQASSSAGAFYGTPARGDLVMVLAFALHLTDPRAVLDGLAGNRSFAMKDLTPVATGPLGGLAECGTQPPSAGGNVAFGVCVWADSGSFGMILMAGLTANQAAGEFQLIRGLVEHR